MSTVACTVQCSPRRTRVRFLSYPMNIPSCSTCLRALVPSYTMPHLIAISSINNHFSAAIFKKVNVVCITRLMADEPQRARLPIPPACCTWYNTATLPCFLWSLSLRIFPSHSGVLQTTTIFYRERAEFNTYSYSSSTNND